MGEPDNKPDAEGPAERAGDEQPVLRSTRLPSTATSALRTSLEAQQARTHELRAALAELRGTLDAGPGAPRPASPPRERPSRSRPLIVGLAVAALVGAVALPLAVVQHSRTPRDGRPSASGPVPARPSPSGPPGAAAAGPSTSASAPGGPSGSASASGTPPSSPPSPSPTQLTTHPLPWPGGPVLEPPGLPASGPGADAPGAEVTAAIDPDERSVDVYERALLRPGVTAVHLAPTGLDPLPGGLRSARPVVTDLQVELDGQAAAPVVAGATGWDVAAPGGRAIGRVVLRYRVVDSLVRQTPAPPGRATVILRPIGSAVVAAYGDPVVVRLSDPRIGSVSCPTAPRPLCAVADGPRHTATVPPGGTAIVLAQVRLG